MRSRKWVNVMSEKTKLNEIDKCFYCGRRLTVYERLFYGNHCEECIQNFKWDNKRELEKKELRGYDRTGI